MWKNVIRKYMIENAPVQSRAALVANQKWLEFTLRFVVDFKLRRATKDELFVLLFLGVFYPERF